MRAQFSHLVVFPTTNKREIATLYDEVSITDRDTFDKITSAVWHDPHDFLFVDLTPGAHTLYSKFDPIHIE